MIAASNGFTDLLKFSVGIATLYYSLLAAEAQVGCLKMRRVFCNIADDLCVNTTQQQRDRELSDWKCVTTKIASPNNVVVVATSNNKIVLIY